MKFRNNFRSQYVSRTVQFPASNLLLQIIRKPEEFVQEAVIFGSIQNLKIKPVYLMEQILMVIMSYSRDCVLQPPSLCSGRRSASTTCGTTNWRLSSQLDMN